jgi:hypothetical protein
LRPGAFHREQAVIRECHEGAAMDIAHAVEVLVLDPERATHAAVVVHPVVEWAIVGIEVVAAPASPTPEFVLGFDVQIGAVEECGFGRVVQAIWPSFEMFGPLNPIHPRCANPGCPQIYGQREIAP